MSAILILLSVLLVLAVYCRVVVRARSAVRLWAIDYGYEVVSARFETAFSRRYQEAGKIAEVVYRVVLASPSGQRQSGLFLMWNLIRGPLTVVVRWEPADSRPG